MPLSTSNPKKPSCPNRRKFVQLRDGNQKMFLLWPFFQHDKTAPSRSSKARCHAEAVCVLAKIFTANLTTFVLGHRVPTSTWAIPISNHLGISAFSKERESFD